MSGQTGRRSIFRLTSLTWSITCPPGVVNGTVRPFSIVQRLVIPVGPDTAIPIGLIVTEAVSNAFDHAFPDSTTPEIRIAAAEVSDNIVVTIDDNGVGFDDSQTALKEGPGLGITLMRGLAAQLGGSVEILRNAEGGTRVRLRFRKPPAAADDTLVKMVPPR